MATTRGKNYLEHNTVTSIRNILHSLLSYTSKLTSHSFFSCQYRKSDRTYNTYFYWHLTERALRSPLSFILADICV